MLLALFPLFAVPGGTAHAMAVVIQVAELVAPVSVDRDWPATQDDYSYQLIGAFFINGSINVCDQTSFDGGQTWSGKSCTFYPAGAKGAKSGGDPQIVIFAPRRGDPPVVVRPTTVRLTLEPVDGVPRVGLLAD